MTRIGLVKGFVLAAAVLAISVAVSSDAQAQQAAPAPQVAATQQVIKTGGVLTGQLNAMRVRAPKGKHVNTFQLVSEPHRLPPPNGLCGLETGPETFQIVTNNDAQAAQLKNFLGKEVSFKIEEISCAQDAGQMSEAVVTKWSVVTKQ